MKFNEYLDLHYDYFRVIFLQLGLTCPLRCRHCSVFASPQRGEQMTPDLVSEIIQSFAATQAPALVVLTGGEPFSMRVSLERALLEAQQCSLRTYVITSGSWAESVDRARAELQSLPPIHLLSVSADIYHEEFVAIDNVKHALTAGVELCEDVILTISTEHTQPDYVSRVRGVVGEQIWDKIEVIVTPVHPTGRAARAGIGSFDTVPEPIPSGACDIAGTPVFTHNGAVSICCQIDAVNEATRGSNTWYRIDSAGKIDVGSMIERTDRDVLVQALRVWGPSELVALLRESGYSIALKESYDGICFLCRDVVRDRQAVARLKELLSTDAASRRLMWSRALQYGEITEAQLEERAEVSQ